MGCVWEVEGWADMHVGTSPSSLRSSLSHHAAPPRWRLTGACQEPEHGRTDRRRLLIAGIRLHTKTTLLQA